MFGLLPPSSRVTGIRFCDCVLHDQPAGGGLAGERDLGDPVARRQRLARLHAEPVDDVEHAGGQQVADQRHQVQDRRRGLLGRLEHHGVAGGQRRGELPDRHQDREVPRDDLPDHAERLVEVVGDGVVVDLGQRALLRADAPGEVAEVVDGQRDVGVQGLADRLAVVPGLGDARCDSRFSSMRSAILLRITARSAAEVLPQAGAAACAASSALLDVGLVGAGDLAERLAGDRGGVLEVAARPRGRPTRRR